MKVLGLIDRHLNRVDHATNAMRFEAPGTLQKCAVCLAPFYRRYSTYAHLRAFVQGVTARAAGAMIYVLHHEELPDEQTLQLTDITQKCNCSH
jgi:hypothetical protein